ncbi:MAG: helix-turn-helix transcriptional regulator [Myxococcota bacterium]
MSAHQHDPTTYAEAYGSLMLSTGEHVVWVELLDEPPCWPEELTETERSIARALMRGASVSAIAEERQTSLHTVTNQLHAMYSKMGISGRSAFIVALFERARAQRAGRSGGGA